MVVPATTTASPDGIQQYYASQELRNVMKWRRVTWYLGADFEGQDNIALFKRVPVRALVLTGVVVRRRTKF